jgi:glycosyltransferase involved in cell wall biosynthesis
VIQYSSPIFQQLAQDPRIDLLVVYCSLQGSKSRIDPEFGVEIAWDTPVLVGYPWVEVPNRAIFPGLGRFFGLFNPGLWKLIRSGKFDAIFIPGYFYASAWIAIFASRWFGIPILFGTDAHHLRTWSTQASWKVRLKRGLIRRIFGLGQAVLAGSSGTVDYLKSLRIPNTRIVLCGNILDNSWWLGRAAEADRDAVRAAWQVPKDASVTLFCGKLQPWKGPFDLLEAFSRVNVPDSYLVFAGDGPLRKNIEERAHALGISDRIRMLGFVNQSLLPSVYCASDLLVLPSLYEPFGFVVNEAMLCGCPVAVSDRVGARFDLVRHDENGYVFPAGDVEGLVSILQAILSDPAKRARMGVSARKRMETWSPREYIDRMATAIELITRIPGPSGPVSRP